VVRSSDRYELVRPPGQSATPSRAVSGSICLIVLSFVLLAVCFERSARSGPGEVASEPIRRITEDFPSYLTWIAQKTGWREAPAPSIRVVSEEQLSTMFFGSPNGFMGIRPKALYSFADHVIFLSVALDPSNLLDRSIVVHELVHHSQVTNVVIFACRGQYETQAYELQAQWLHEHGVEHPFKLMQTNRTTIAAMSECP
jgi:hypothetical protein